MMEIESPRHSPSNDLLSPPHAHPASFDGYASIQQLRRSLSKSPCKPGRSSMYHTRATTTTPPSAPLSPLSRPYGMFTFAATDPLPKPRYSVRRNVNRTVSRRTSPNSPLRLALSDSTNQANASPQFSIRLATDFDQENMDCRTDSPTEELDVRLGEPSKMEFLKPDKLLQPVKDEHASPMKSSPLKRSDGVMNLEAATFGSPKANKRRSLHADFNILDQGLDGTQSDSADSSSEEKEGVNGSAQLNAIFNPVANSPQRRAFRLRKSTIQQRNGPARSKLLSESSRESPSMTRTRSRISLDSTLPMRSFELDSPFRFSGASDPPLLFPPPAQKLYQSAPKPHPLSHALTPSSSASSVKDEQSHGSHSPQKSDTRKVQPSFSKSLPIGAIRPSPSTSAEASQTSSQESFETPHGYKMAKPLPQAFMSTGLISKRNRNMDMPSAALYGSVHMPDTPSKKAHVIIASSPAPPSGLGKVSQPVHEFGSPSTPFNGRTSKISPGGFGRGVNIFGTRVGAPQLTRRGSFLGLDVEDMNNSPSQPLESQSSNDELPPTPTKSTSTATRPQSKGKSNSLRSSLFGRRTSLGPDTFASPTNGEVSPEETTDSSNPMDGQAAITKQSPHTPHEWFTPPDPSNLSISMEQRRPSTTFGSSNSFPPATPTGPRDHAFNSSIGPGHASSSYFSNDVDTALTSRFGYVTTLGIGEFSQVYRVENPLAGGSAVAQRSVGSAGNVWAVKKSRKPYSGNKDRQRKMREVQILRALRGHEHLIEQVDFWESKGYLYIQTEFCENGNLKDFLTQTGFKGRLDDFRIWKILLETSQGVKAIHDAGFIHLDLKPANVFIDWEGVLKIGDFGLASSWPAPLGLDGEGDREYIGPEVLSGRFDKPADIFSLGMIMLEIAGNIILPDNGTSWQRLRAGDMSDLPSLTGSSESSLVRDDSGEPIDLMNGPSNDSLCNSNQGDDDLSFLRPVAPKLERSKDLVEPPNFMVDSNDPQALDCVVQWMIRPNPDQRPDIDQLLAVGGVQWVEHRRRAGATVYEGNWGPADDVLNHEQDVEMLDI